MTHTYRITGMTCDGCANHVKRRLLSISGITDVVVDLPNNEAKITMEKHFAIPELQEALKNTKYTIEEKETQHNFNAEPVEEPVRLKTFLPVFLIFGYITITTLIIQFNVGGFNFMQWMQHFMAGFFLVFSFFKLLDVPAFAMSYMSYDLIAKKWNGYGFIYPFIELALGLLFLLSVDPFAANLITLLIMSVSMAGVIQTMLSKRKFQCACLGAVFKLPLSKITLFEDGLMIAMSAVSLFMLAS